MEAGHFERLVQLMARLAVGDRTAVVALYKEYGAHLGACIRRHARRFGVDHVTSDDLDGLVLDACFALEACAASWDPGRGALPWTWAERRIGALVSAWVGIHAESVDDGATELAKYEAPPGSADTELIDLIGLLDGLATRDQDCRLLLEAITEVLSPRNRSMLLEVKVQASLGDPAPAVTVARELGMSPAAVRQAVKRSLDSLRSLAASDPHYGGLVDLALLAA